MAALVSGLKLEPDRDVGYREEVQHPALARPEVASGTMHLAQDGTLVRDQVVPERQISEVGENFVTVRDGPDTEPNLYPIPGELRPMLSALRGLLAGDLAVLEATFAADLSTGESGWILTLKPLSDPSLPAIDFAGCGNMLQRMEIDGGDGIRRTLTFSPGE